MSNWQCEQVVITCLVCSFLTAVFFSVIAYHLGQADALIKFAQNKYPWLVPEEQEEDDQDEEG